MNTQTRTSNETFTVADGHLVRNVMPARGRPYEHRCSLDSFREVLFAMDALADGGFTLEELVKHANLPSSRVAVALAFLKERGCIETRYRRNYPVERYLHEDGMIEYWALTPSRNVRATHNEPESEHVMDVVVDRVGKAIGL